MNGVVKDELMNRIVQAICEIYDNNLKSVILYGSVARDDDVDGSDIDIALLVDENDLTMHDKLMDVLVDLDLEYDQVISPSLIEKKHFEKWKNVLPYYRNIENEGIVLWKAA